ncbi:3-deoxy-D-manno-octulosonic acid transferase [Acinetobacter qingfengensis]|uniref:3-deoxy-D-manno-octulosonic acid transferase n=1 Tax=Acinetobacter qingfengensis TaxID=1262585 RepID=A0A1E7QWN5_9GAMM|nr:3-deoxy-D-manno-octulosonic acid transferase [Acinetobacter qingfengensis]OEY91524.1 3-deoxy-D-manno-2-octulosonate transferase [Acinetobacter qingfengensis]
MTTPLWYNSLLTLIKPLYRLRVKQRFGHLDDYQQEVDERFGNFQPVKNKNTIWFHAVSVGETNAAQPLIEHYLKLGQAVLVTNTTRTGQARAKSLFAEKYPTLFQAVYLPIDQKHLIEKFVVLNQPRILLLMETELWPNLLSIVHQHHIPQLLLNARLSEKSAKGYGKFQRLTFPMLQQLDWIAAQDQATFDRFHHLGKSQSEMSVVGNVKFDITAPKHFIQQASQLRQEWQLQQRKIMVLASTHAAEEQQILAALTSALFKDKDLLCIVVPRHPERFDAVFTEIEKLGLKAHRRSLGQTIEPDTQVYLADSMGELWLWYALAQVAYVGGSLNEPGGGHNILEPIALNVPTILGKNYFNFQHIIDEFVEHDAVKVVQNTDEAAQILLDLFDNQAQRDQMNQQAQQILQANQGALAQHIALIDRYLVAQ